MTRAVRRADAVSVEQAIASLKTSAPVALPTETVYGLAACADDAQAIARVFDTKQRPRFNPLIIHVADAQHAQDFADWSPAAEALTRALWPGPLTLVLPRKPNAPVADLAVAGLNTIALRAPAHPLVRAVIAGAGAIAMPSANPSGGLSPTTAADVARALPETVPIVDGGPARHGVESTVVGLVDQPSLLRPGPIDRETLTALVGPLTDGLAHPERPQSPGQLASHYAPARARLRLNVISPHAHEAYLGFGPTPWSSLNLSPRADLTEAAARLFTALRALDEAGFDEIAVAPIPHKGLGEAINDRLRRAAAGAATA